MPELPEVETTRRGIESHVVGRALQALIVRDRRLRWPVPEGLEQTLAGQHLRAVERRAKYLLFRFERGTLMLHLGMSGSLRVLLAPVPADRHDHIDMAFGTVTLRYTDPRRFGSVHWLSETGDRHALLDHLGPEPLGEDFNGAHLYRLSRGRRAAVKVFIMDSAVVVGVGNIYASESLHAAGIDPRRAAGKVSRARYDALAEHIKAVLARAIEAGGTTLRDFVSGEGKPGYFAQELMVYGRAGEPCKRCGGVVRQQKLGQRATYFCPDCQR